MRFEGGVFVGIRRGEVKYRFFFKLLVYFEYGFGGVIGRVGVSIKVCFFGEVCILR